MALAFDASFYLSTYPDVAAAISRGTVQSAEQHYNDFGRFESRNPNAFFNTAFYLAQYPDVASARVNPFQHFLANGAGEGRLTNATEKAAIDLNGNGSAGDDFNAAKYVADYPDVGNAIAAGTLKSAYQHFVVFGQFEGRTATLTNGTTVTGPITNSGVAPGTGATTVFTSGIDVLNGTNGNDTFLGDSTTVSAADRVNGGAGIDTLSLVDTSTLPTLSGIERVEFTNNTAARTVDLSGVTGLTDVVLKNGFTGGTLTSAAGVVTTFDTTTVAASTATTAATATAQTIQLTNGSNVTTLTANGAAVTNLTIQSNGSAANTIGTLAGSAGATANANSTLTITGSQKLTVTNALDTDFTTVNASGSTGGVDVTFGANNVSATGGSGNDRFSFGANLTTADTVVGGAGTDTISVAGADYSAVVANGTLAALNTKVTGFEVLEFTGSTAAQISGTTFTNSEVTKILFNTADAATDTIASAGATRTYAFGELNTGAATLTGTAGVTSFNVSLEGIAAVGATPANGGNISTLTTNFTNSSAAQVGTGTINIASVGANGAVNSIDLVNAQSNGGALTTTSVVITGSHDLTIGSALNAGAAANTGFGSAVNVNASAFTGKLDIFGSTAQDTIVGGSGNDTIRATAGGDTYTGGAGADTFVFNNVNQGSSNSLTTIADFVSGTDKINVAGIAGVGTFNATAVNVTSAPDFQSALNLAAASTGAGDVTYFQQGGNTYLVVDTNNGTTFDAATDAVIKITGLVTLTANDIVVA